MNGTNLRDIKIDGERGRDEKKYPVETNLGLKPGPHDNI